MDTILSKTTEKQSKSRRYTRLDRYHVKRGQRRTTITLDKILSTLLSLKLRIQPESEEAHKAVRQWLQRQIDKENDPGRVLVSEWLQKEVILYLVEETTLNKAYGDWLLSQD